MSNTDVAVAFAAALTAHDLDKAASLLTDDATITGLGPAPMNPHMFLADMRIWFAGCPDWAATPGATSENGDTVTGTVTITATQTGTLALPGAPVLPASGKHISSTDQATFTIRDGKIATMNIVEGEPPLMAQLMS